MLADILTVLKQLVQYGYYDDDEDVNDVLAPLTKILDGKCVGVCACACVCDA